MRAKYKERPFAFMTTDGFRIEVKAIHPIQAYYRARKKAEKSNKVITNTYTTYGRDKIATNWKYVKGVKNRDYRLQSSTNLLNSGTVKRESGRETNFGGDTGADADFGLVTEEEMDEGNTQRDIDLQYNEDEEEEN